MRQVFNAAAMGSQYREPPSLADAVRMGDIQIIELLLKHGADPNLGEAVQPPEPEPIDAVVTPEPDVPPPEALETGKVTVMKPLRLKRMPQGKLGA